MATYYLFDRSDDPGRWIQTPRGDNVPPLKWSLWRKGEPLPSTEIIVDPIRFTLKPLSPFASDHGPHMPSYLEASAPIFNDSLIAALLGCGVDNLDAYGCAITDPDNGEVHADYKVINIIGLVAAADMHKSNATVHPNGPALIDVDFDGLVIDEAKARGRLFFRLAESTNAIIIHEKVKDQLLSLGFTDLAFHDLQDVAL